MDTYYEDILKKVETLMKDAQFAEAYAILDEELSMPYIPREYEEPLIAYYNQCRSECKWKDTAVREEDIETLLKGSLEEAFLAIEQLKKSNIRNHMDAVADYLSPLPDPENPFYIPVSLRIRGAAVPRNLLPALSQILLHPAAYTHILILHKGVHLPKHRFLAIASMGIAAPCFYQLIPFCDGMQVIHLLLSV